MYVISLYVSLSSALSLSLSAYVCSLCVCVLSPYTCYMGRLIFYTRTHTHQYRQHEQEDIYVEGDMEIEAHWMTPDGVKHDGGPNHCCWKLNSKGRDSEFREPKYPSMYALVDGEHYPQPDFIVSVSCGRCHTMALTNTGMLWCAGDRMLIEGAPMWFTNEIEAHYVAGVFHKPHAHVVACCANTDGLSYALTDDGDVYSWYYVHNTICMTLNIVKPTYTLPDWAMEPIGIYTRLSREKKLAFAMGTHERLGGGVVREVEADAVTCRKKGKAPMFDRDPPLDTSHLACHFLTMPNDLVRSLLEAIDYGKYNEEGVRRLLGARAILK